MSSTKNGAILQDTRRETPSAKPAEIEDTIADVVAELRRGHDVAAVGIGAAGFIDAAGAVVLFAPNLAWRNEPLRDEVAARIGLPVVVENDANAAAWAEYRFGVVAARRTLSRSRSAPASAAASCSTARCIRGRFGIAAEFGHMQVVPNGRRCGCGQRGCWEQYASGRALLREAREIAHFEPARAAQLLALGDGTPEGITGPHVTDAAVAGDAAAVEAFDVVGRWLGVGLANLAVTLDPGVFLIGGGVSDAGELLLGPARAAFAERLPGAAYRPVPNIRRAELGNEAGLVGAADLARLRG